MPLRDRQLILAKIESTYGVDPTPVANTNAILAEIADISIVSRSLERNNAKSYFGQLAPVNIGDGLKLDFTTEVKGSGAAGTAPEIGVLFRACNYTETVVAVTSVTYDPNSNVLDSESITLYFYQDGIRHKLLGARGTFSFEANAGEYGKVKWSFTGLYAGPTDTALATGTYNSTLPPRFVSASFALDSYAFVISNLKIDAGNTVVERKDANNATGISAYFIRERKVTGEIDPEAVTVATKDIYTMWSASSRVAMTATLGATAGNICTITGPKVALSDIKYGERNGLLTTTLPLVFTPNAGNDELKIAFT